MLLSALMLLSLSACARFVPDAGTKDEAGKKYTNESLEMTYTLPDGWEFMSPEQVEESVASSGGTVAKTVDDLNSKPGSLYYAMWAIDKATGNNVSIAYIGAGRGSVLNTVDDYIAEIKKSGNDTEALKELGMTYEFGDVTDIQIGGLVYKKMATTLSSDTLSVRQDYCIAKKGDYLIVIYLTAMIDTDPGEFLNAFSGIN